MRHFVYTLSSLSVSRVSVHCSEVVTCHLKCTAEQQISFSCALAMPMIVRYYVCAGGAESVLSSWKAGTRFWLTTIFTCIPFARAKMCTAGILPYHSHTCVAVCCLEGLNSIPMESVPAS